MAKKINSEKEKELHIKKLKRKFWIYFGIIKAIILILVIIFLIKFYFFIKSVK